MHALSLIILFVFGGLLSLQAQLRLGGHLQSADTGTPIVYAHIGVLNSGLGSISDERGDFEILSRESLSADQVIQFSAVGFKTAQITVKQLQQDPVVKLKPQAAVLPEITVSDRHRTRTSTGGHYGRSRKVVTGWSYAIGRGGIRTARIKIPNRATDVVLDQLRFHLAYNEFDSVLFRLHFFYPDANGKLPGDRIPLVEDLYIHHSGATGDISFDLQPYDILVDQDFFAGIEVVRTYGECSSSECLHFSVVLFKDRIYFRNTITDRWDAHKLGSPAIEVDMRY